MNWNVSLLWGISNLVVSVIGKTMYWSIRIFKICFLYLFSYLFVLEAEWEILWFNVNILNKLNDI